MKNFNIKSVISLVLILTVFVSLVGCGNESSSAASNPVPIDLSAFTDEQLSLLASDVKEKLSTIDKSEPSFYNVSFTPLIKTADVDKMLDGKLAEYEALVAKYEEKGRSIAEKIAAIDEKINKGDGDVSALMAEKESLSAELTAVQAEAEKYALPERELIRAARNEIFDEYNGKMIRDFIEKFDLNVREQWYDEISCIIYNVEMTAEKIEEIIKSGESGFMIKNPFGPEEDHDH